MVFLQPPFWSTEQLAVDRQKAIDLFVEDRRAADSAVWAAKFEEVRAIVRDVFVATDNVRSITADALLAEPTLWWHALRYCCGPPVSEEDLWTFVGGTKFKRVSSAWAEHTAEIFRLFIDDVRFPWVREHRDPTDDELNRALYATVMPFAQQRFATGRRGVASRRQEAAVGAVLHTAGFERNESRTHIDVLDELPRGSFSRERIVAATKCDVPLRLGDGRLLAIECKASNGPKNGWKRLNNEVGGKAARWRGEFGQQVVTAAVLSGVFDLAALQRAQHVPVTIFWEHDLDPLVEFALAAVP